MTEEAKITEYYSYFLLKQVNWRKKVCGVGVSTLEGFL